MAINNSEKTNKPSLALTLSASVPFSVTRLADLLNFGQLFKALATINLPKSPAFLGNFCKGVKIYHFSSEIIFGQLLKTFGDFFLVTLAPISPHLGTQKHNYT